MPNFTHPGEILCPIRGPIAAPSIDLAELEPLLAALRADVRVEAPTEFPRGTLHPDGRLDLCKAGLGVAGCVRVAEALSANTFVTSLLLGTNGAGDEGALAVAQLLGVSRSLEVVYLGCNGIGPAGAEAVARAASASPSARGVWLKRNPLTPAGLTGLLPHLAGGSLRVIDLVNVAPGDESWSKFLWKFAANPGAVEHLYLGGNGLGAASAPALAQWLAGAPNLRGLYLNVNHLGDAGAAELADGLRRNRTLTHLGMASNGLGPDGVSALADALAGHPALESLDLGFSPSTRVLGCAANEVDERAALFLAEMICSAPALRSLDLARTGVSGPGLDALAFGAESSASLVKLAYSGPHHARLDAALARNAAVSGTPPAAPHSARVRSTGRAGRAAPPLSAGPGREYD